MNNFLTDNKNSVEFYISDAWYQQGDINYFRELSKTTLSPITHAPLLEADILLAHTLNTTRSYLYAHSDDLLSNMTVEQLIHLIKRRKAGEPLAYIIGKKEFWSIELNITPDVLIPRPETEQLVELALTLKDCCALNVADLGTGSGAIALAIAKERPHWRINATDISIAALTVAAKNANKLGLTNVFFYQGDWFLPLPKIKYDLLISNPPYIAAHEWPHYIAGLKYEPQNALVSGEDGLEAIQILIFEAKNYLTRNGCLFIEHGLSQGLAVRQLFKSAGYVFETYQDIAGLDRITCGRISS